MVIFFPFLFCSRGFSFCAALGAAFIVRCPFCPGISNLCSFPTCGQHLVGASWLHLHASLKPNGLQPVVKLRPFILPKDALVARGAFLHTHPHVPVGRGAAACGPTRCPWATPAASNSTCPTTTTRTSCGRRWPSPSPTWTIPSALPDCNACPPPVASSLGMPRDCRIKCSTSPPTLPPSHTCISHRIAP